MDFITSAIAKAIEQGPAPLARRSTRPRDTQRSKVYAAENAAFDKSKSEGMSVEDVERFVAEVWRSDTAKAMRVAKGDPDRGAPRVADGRGCRWARGGVGKITIPLWARSRWIVLHELAHSLTSRRHAAHGPEFCRNYLELVERFLGFEARERLGWEMLKRRVKTRP